IQTPPSSTLCPYTTLFRSSSVTQRGTNRLDAEEGTARIDSKLRVKLAFGHVTRGGDRVDAGIRHVDVGAAEALANEVRNFAMVLDRKSTRLNSSHVKISYA